MRTSTAFRVLLLAATASSASAECVNPTGANGCHTTIQAAVDAADEGERIDIAPGVYVENVYVGKAGLTLAGPGPAETANTIIDADDPNDEEGLYIDASDVKIKDLTVRNGRGDGIGIYADRVKILGVRVLSPDSDCIWVSDYDDVQIVGNELRGCGDQGIESDDSSELVVKNNVISICDEGCLDLYGNGIQVVGNTISQSEDDACIYVEGDFATVKANTVSTCDGSGIEVNGQDPVVSGNTVTASSSGEGVEVDCDPCTGGQVSRNKVSDLADDESGFDIWADAAGLVVSGNVATRVPDQGFQLYGTGIQFLDNQSFSTGGDDDENAFEIYGDSHTVEGNRAEGGARAGFFTDCTGCTFTGNLAVGNLESGFVIYGLGNTLTGNKAFDNLGHGFWLGGEDNNFASGNVSRRNRSGWCDDGSIDTTIGVDNKLGDETACVIDNDPA